MSKPIPTQCENLKRYGSHLEKIIKQARQTSHAQKSSTTLNNTQKITLQDQILNLMSGDKKHDMPTINRTNSRTNSKTRYSNSHRKSLSNISKEIKAVVKKIRPAQSRCKSEFVQSPNHKSMSTDKKSMDEESSGQISKLDKVELAVQMPTIEEVGRKELLEEKINAYQAIIKLLKNKYTQLKVIHSVERYFILLARIKA